MNYWDTVREGFDAYFADLGAIFSNSILEGVIYLILGPLVLLVYYL